MSYSTFLLTNASTSATPPAGFRLSEIRWKSMPNKPALSANRGVYLPIIPVTVTPLCLATALRDALENIQDSIVREDVEGQITRGVATPTIDEQSMTVEAIATSYAATAVSTRLTGDMISTWFKAEVKDQLALAFAAKQGLSPEMLNADNIKPMEVAAEQRGATLSKLSSPGFRVQPQTAIQLCKVLDLASDQSSKIVTSLRTKLLTMQVVEPVDSFGL